MYPTQVEAKKITNQNQEREKKEEKTEKKEEKKPAAQNGDTTLRMNLNNLF